ncbi:hypothetical protein LX64_03458 [Chitinophaga skermanii]|uniref:Short-subunit dehydrogenase n=1 Tax=Chitinophaga skermanii TaxID=331697 RepID=A0A327QGJ2_9BACT|nr:SDR family oxidoreductase [Chitinophaga skermanii]RAJ02443.1 hypothetical protein LX64_03458 [Chitinophaga skermanii]
MSYALVTGAAKGIGRGIAQSLAAKKYDLLLVDIDAQQLQTTADNIHTQYGVDVQTLHIDLSKEDAIEEIFVWSTPYQRRLHIVVSNAGYGLNGRFDTLALDEQLNMIDVNIKAQVKLAYRFIPVLKGFKQSYLLHVGSTTAYQPVPYLNIYAATKAFVVQFTRGLRHELRSSNISVSCLIPGSTDTDFVHRANMQAHTKKTAEKFNMSPEEVGKIAVRGLLQRKAEIIPGFTNKLNALLPRFFPHQFVAKIAARIYKPIEKTQPAETRYATGVTLV